MIKSDKESIINKIICPICETKVYYDEAKLYEMVNCKKCKSIYCFHKGKLLNKYFSLFVKLGFWLKTNWQKSLIKLGDKIINEQSIYTSRCWNCKAPIKAVITKNKLEKLSGILLYGNKQCAKCNHFLCRECGACFCESPFYIKTTTKPLEHKWVEQEIIQ